MSAYYCNCHVGTVESYIANIQELIFYSTEKLCYNLDSKFYFGNIGYTYYKTAEIIPFLT